MGNEELRVAENSILDLKDYEVVSFKEYCDIDTIRDWDESCWITLGDLDANKKILVDMLYVSMDKPYMSNELKKLLVSKPNLMFKMYNNVKLYHSLNVMCSMLGVTERFIFEEHWENGKPRDKKEVEFEENVDEALECVVANGEVAEFNVSCFRTIVNKGEIRIIKEALTKFISIENPKKMILNMGYISLSEDDIEELIQAINELKKLNCELEFISQNESLMSKIDMKIVYRNVNDVPLRERNQAFKSLGENFPCMLITYKDGKGFDEYGRRRAGNKVEILSCRAALIRGVDNGKVIVDTFNGEKFYPVDHWSVLYDGNVPDELPSNRMNINLKDIGLTDKMLGVKYHVNRAIQEEIKDSCTIHEMVDNFNSETKEVIIPERFRLVFESWGIDYNREEIAECIEISLKNLGMDEQS